MDTKSTKIKNLILRFKDLATLGSANIIATGISAVFWLYMASLLGTTNYGEVSYFIAISGIASIVSLIGIGTAIIVYSAKEIKIQATSYFIVIISSIVTSIILFIFLHSAGVSLYIIGYAIFTLGVNEMLGRKFFRKYSIYTILQRVLLVGLSIGLYYVMGTQGVILGYALSFFPFLFFAYKAFRETRVDFSLVKSRIVFIINSYALDLSRIFSGSTDKLIIYPLFGFSLLGNYQLGIQVFGILGMVPGIVYQYVLPHDASGNTNKKLKQLTVLVSVILALLGIFLSPHIIPVLFPKFKEAVDVIRIMSIASIPQSINLMYISKFIGTEKNRIVLIGSGIYLTIQIATIFSLGKIYGINGVASSIVIASIAETIYLVSIEKIIQRKRTPKGDLPSPNI